MMGRINLGIWLLAAGQTLTYAGVYYAFAALLPDLVAATGWRLGDLAAGPVVSFLVMALALPVTGRLLDLGHGGAMMLAGPALGALALLGLSQVGALWQWNLLWGLIGLAMAGCVYETCFALITRALGSDGAARGAMTARAAIIRITLVAGFASTLAFPLGHWWGAALGGQGAFAAFAGLTALAIPLNWWGLSGLGHRGKSAHHPAAAKGLLRAALRRPAFWTLAAIFAAVTAAHGILMTYILVLFAERGASAGMAALAASCVGPAQVLGRLALMAAGGRISNQTATFLSIGALILASGALIAAGAAPLLIFAFAALQGAGAGLYSILRPVLVADHMGRAGFGVISSAISVGSVLANAGAPALGAGLLRYGGAGLVYGASLALCFAALILAVAILFTPRRTE